MDRRAELADRVRFPGAAPDPDPAWGEVWQGEGYSVRTVAFDARQGFRIGAAWFAPEEPSEQGVIMAHGHFQGGAKSSPEAQDLAHRLAGAGVPVLVVDGPGEEEWGHPDRALHFQRGAHNRAWLWAGGSSALALQLAGLVSGLDLMASLGVRQVVATGASGGAVLSFWLAVADDRVSGVVLASAPDVPRPPDAAGCACKLVWGLPGPDPGVVAALPVPSLWLKESEGPRLEGLPESATWKLVPSVHGYGEPMQREALAWIAEHLGRPLPGWRPSVPRLDLRTAGRAERRSHRRLWSLPLAPEVHWTPRPVAGLEATTSCSGEGPVVVVLGAQDLDLHALHGAGFRTCELVLSDDRWGPAAAATLGQVYADRVAGAVGAAVEREGAVAAWGVGGFGIAVAGAGVPHVLRSPPTSPDDLDTTRDPPWVHVPGIWWGGLPVLTQEALAVDDLTEPLVAALKRPR